MSQHLCMFHKPPNNVLGRPNTFSRYIYIYIYIYVYMYICIYIYIYINRERERFPWICYWPSPLYRNRNIIQLFAVEHMGIRDNGAKQRKPQRSHSRPKRAENKIRLVGWTLTKFYLIFGRVISLSIDHIWVVSQNRDTPKQPSHGWPFSMVCFNNHGDLGYPHDLGNPHMIQLLTT